MLFTVDAPQALLLLLVWLVILALLDLMQAMEFLDIRPALQTMILNADKRLTVELMVGWVVASIQRFQ